MNLTSNRVVAHFLLNHHLAGSPPNTAILSAYKEAGIDVHLYTPNSSLMTNLPEGCTEIHDVSYSYRWLAKNLLKARWRKYMVLSGTTEDPMAVVGLLAKLFRLPYFTLADEIYSGSYSGNRNQRWKNICRTGMRTSSFTIVNDKSRVELQRDYCNTKNEIIVYPGSFHVTPNQGCRTQLREVRNIPKDALVLCYSGVINFGNGGDWLPQILSENHDIFVWGQFIDLDPMIESLLNYVVGSDRIIIEKERLGWKECWSSMAAADIGLVVYTHDGPQFQNMGISSNRLCMFLSMGIPVIARRQPSFAFIEEYNCGILVDNAKEAATAIQTISSDLATYKYNALICADNYIMVSKHYANLKSKISNLIN